MNGLTFDDASHAYMLDGERVPSVTQILGAIACDEAPLVCRDGWTKKARERGSDVHLAIQLHLANNLNVATLTPEIVPYFEAFRLFERETGFAAAGSEDRLASRRHRFAGTIDLLGTMNGDKRLTLIDVKSGDPAPWHRLQLGGYAELLSEIGFDVERMFVLSVKGGEKPRYKLHEFAGSVRDARADFLACRRVFSLCGDPMPGQGGKDEDHDGDEFARSYQFGG